VDLNIQSEDKEIIDSFLIGNKNAFNIIVLKYQKRVYWTVRRMVVDHDDADDITQEVFVKLYSSLKDFRGESTLFTYLYKIAINYSLNHIKKNKNKMLRETPIDDDFTEKYSDNNTSDSSMESQSKNKIISEAILILPEQQRAVFNMRFYDDMTYEEISSVLNKSVGGLKANYFHAFKKIQTFLKDKKLKGFID
jgi:RNA polymerase sigma-70 factor (ECF subfamily)